MNIPLDLNAVWFVLVGVLFTGYAILDGFDLGVGSLHLFTKTDAERRLMMQSIGPVWDGNEVWLVVGGGALFAAFPEVYATIFSGFYIAFMLLLFGLIFRAVSIEFRSKMEMKWWRSLWDTAFCASSVLCAFLIGVAVGNIAWGVPLDAQHEYAGTFFTLLNPYSILVGITTVALFAAHGAIYVVLKTEGEFQQKIRKWVIPSLAVFTICYALTTLATLVFLPKMTDIFQKYPILLLVPVLNGLAIMNIPRELSMKRDAAAFVSSCAAMLLLMIIFGLGMFPHMIFSHTDPQNSLNIYNAASSQKTLGIMLIMAAIGLPLVAAYTISIYWIFRGKIKLKGTGY